jgi:hypothetical protein
MSFLQQQRQLTEQFNASKISLLTLSTPIKRVIENANIICQENMMVTIFQKPNYHTFINICLTTLKKKSN